MPFAVIFSAQVIKVSLAAPEEALAKHGIPDIFNTDQGGRFTSSAKQRNPHLHGQAVLFHFYFDFFS